MTSATRRRQKLRLVEPTSEMQRVCFYCRVSTDEQADQNTIDLQLDYLRGRFRPDFDGRGPVPMQFVEEFVDEGWSGAIPLEDRPGGARLLEAAAEGRFDVLAVYKVDRLGRKASVLLQAHDDLEARGVALTSATEPFDTRPGPMQAFGVFVFQLLGSIAQLERSTIEIRTMGGKLQVAKRGEFVNGAVPFGYKVCESGLLVPNDTIVPQVGVTESELVAQLFQRIAGGESTYALGEWLADLGVHSPRRWYNKEHQRVTEADEATPWSNRRVWETIRNETYKGERFLSFGHADHTQAVPPLVQPKLWDRANEKMRERNAWKRDRTDETFLYLLARKIQCQCGLLYTGGKANGYAYYKCNGTKLRHGPRCRARMIRADRIETAVWGDLTWKLRHPAEALELAQSKLRDRQTQSVVQADQRVALRKELASYEAARAHLRRQRREGRRLDEIEEDLLANAQDIARLEARLAEINVVLDMTGEMERQFAQAATVMAEIGAELDAIEATQDRPKMRALIDKLVQQITLDDPQSKHPQVTVSYTFALGEATATIREFTNIQTIVVMAPQARSA